jgi:glycine/D-amino acid oxidase-like deaminating enzyme
MLLILIGWQLQPHPPNGILDGIPAVAIFVSRVRSSSRQLFNNYAESQQRPIRSRRSYLDALARAIEAKGGRIFNKTQANGFNDGAPGQVTTAKGAAVSAGAIVVATNTPVNDCVEIHT